MENKFYWIKLKTNFFEENTIDFLMSQKNGSDYVVLYQMLCLKTANTNGRLESSIGEMIVPYSVDKIVRDCKYFSIDTVNIAMALYRQLGLIYEESDGVLKISNHSTIVGSETQWAEKKRIYREKKNMLLQQGQELGQKKDIVRQENKSIENKSIENREEEYIKENSNINIRAKENRKSRTFTPPTEQEVCDYANSRGRGDLARAFYDYYTATEWHDSKGQKVKSWKGKFITWEQNNAVRNAPAVKMQSDMDIINELMQKYDDEPKEFEI